MIPENDDEELRNLIESTNKDINKAHELEVGSPQLEELKKRESGNKWASIFMNLIGSANGIDMSKFSQPFEQDTRNQQNQIELQNRLSQQQLQSALSKQNLGLNQFNLKQAVQKAPLQRQQEEQNVGLGGIKFENAKNENAYNNAPADKIKLATLAAFMKQAKQPFNPDEYKNATNAQIDKVIGNVQKLAQNQVSLDKSYQYLGTKGWIKYQNKDGDTHIYNQLTGEDKPLTSSSPIEKDKNYSYSDITGKDSPLSPNQIKDFKQKINPIIKDSSKLIQDENEYNTAVKQLREEAEKALHGNFVAARSLPDREARVLGGMKQALTNMQVQMQKDPRTKGFGNFIESKLKEISGQGNLNQTEYQMIMDLTKSIEKARQENYDKLKDLYRNKAESLVGVPLNIDNVLFGKSREHEESNKIVPKRYSSLDEYEKQLKGGL